jgi:hypothetical protein
VRIRRQAPPIEGQEDWVEASVRIDSFASALPEMLALGGEIEIIRPPELRGPAPRRRQANRGDQLGLSLSSQLPYSAEWESFAVSWLISSTNRPVVQVGA